MKWLLIIFLGLVLISGVSALTLCSDQMDFQQNCSFITPALNCSTYMYWIYDVNGSQVLNGSLTTYYTEDVYYLNFSQPEGKYYIALCDGSNKLVVVGDGGGNMIVGVLILIPLLLMFVFLKWSEQLGDDHKAMRLFFQLLVLPLGFVALQFAIYSVVKFYGWNDMLVGLADLSTYLGYIGMAIGIYILVYIFYKVVKHFSMDKDKPLYDDEEVDL